ASRVHSVGRISAKPPNTTYLLTCPEASVTETAPGLIVVMVGAWFVITVISASVAGLTTSVTFLDTRRRSGETSSKLKASAMAVHFFTCCMQGRATVAARLHWDAYAAAASFLAFSIASSIEPTM